MSRYKILLVLALIYFFWRAPIRWIRGTNHYNDFSISYIDGRAWLEGRNPYTAESFMQMWDEGGGVHELSQVNVETAFALPTAIPFITAFVWFLSWIHVSTLLLVFSLAAFLVMIGALYRLYGLKSVALAAFCLSLTAFHGAIYGQNIVSILIPVIVLSLLLVANGNEVGAGVLLGIGTCFKPQVVLIIVAFLLVKKHLRTCIACLATVSASFGVFIVFAQNGTMAAFHKRLSSFALNDPNDFGLNNPARYELINLQLIPASLGYSRFTCNVIAWTICILLCLYWYFRTERVIEPIVLIGLLPFYHRYVDAGLLVLPIALMLKTRPKFAWLSVPFFAPVPVALYLKLGDRGPVWNSMVLCHQVWLLLGFSIALLVYTRSANRSANRSAHSYLPREVS